jgi:hypothetical protein
VGAPGAGSAPPWPAPLSRRLLCAPAQGAGRLADALPGQLHAGPVHAPPDPLRPLQRDLARRHQAVRVHQAVLLPLAVCPGHSRRGNGYFNFARLLHPQQQPASSILNRSPPAPPAPQLLLSRVVLPAAAFGAAVPAGRQGRRCPGNARRGQLRRQPRRLRGRNHVGGRGRVGAGAWGAACRAGPGASGAAPAARPLHRLPRQPSCGLAVAEPIRGLQLCLTWRT